MTCRAKGQSDGGDSSCVPFPTSAATSLWKRIMRHLLALLLTLLFLAASFSSAAG